MDFFDLPMDAPLVPLSRSSQTKSGGGQERCWGHFVGIRYAATKVEKALAEALEPWQLQALKKQTQEVLSWGTPKGTVHVVKPLKVDKVTGKGPQGLLGRSLFAAWMELGGVWASKVFESPSSVHVSLWGLSPVELKGLFCGFEMGAYKYRSCGSSKKSASWSVSLKDCGPEKSAWVAIEGGQNLGRANNLARHLINTPPNTLYPESFSKELSKVFKGFPQIKVEVWNRARLEKEKMGLHLAVGQGSVNEPRLVRLSYKPRGKTGRPVAFVGKGITFDSGGLDIKPSSGMRLMKKDMGGAASLTALAWWVAKSQPKVACEFYLAMAENSVSGNSFRPSDILKSRSGLTVEVDNTDAEGRLVLADALTLAREAKPQAMINLATLTGAIKVGLGSDLAGLFSNRDELAKELLRHGFEQGDLCWQMPLYAPMARGLKSPVADMVNCTSGFGGAVTAALFLQKFVGDTPWAHVDIYGWQDKAEGAYSEAGGRSQMVLALSSWLQSL